jgi:hypothetical protein
MPESDPADEFDEADDALQQIIDESADQRRWLKALLPFCQLQSESEDPLCPIARARRAAADRVSRICRADLAE